MLSRLPSMPRRLWQLVSVGSLGLVLLASEAGCAHGGASFEDGVFRKGDNVVRVGPVPPAWRRIEVTGADLAFRDDERSGSALLLVRCGSRDDDAPLSVLTNHLIMGTTEREFDAQDIIPFDRREALHTLLRARLDGVPMQYDIYVMKKDGCVYDLVYVAPPDRFAEGATGFERFASGVTTGPASSARSAEAPASMSRDP
jgi:hypothetical protein